MGHEPHNRRWCLILDELLDGRVVISGALPGRSWQEGLERAAAAVERELAGGLGPASLGGGHHCGQAAGYAEHSIAEYAEAVGVHPETLKNYRTVARAHRQKPRRRDISFGMYQALAAHPGRLELVAGDPMTVAQARELVAGKSGNESRRSRGYKSTYAGQAGNSPDAASAPDSLQEGTGGQAHTGAATASQPCRASAGPASRAGC